MNSSKVAVIMSVYRGDSLDALEESVESIFEQSIDCDLYIYRDGKVSELIDTKLNDYSKMESVYVITNDVNHGLAYALNSLIDIVIDKNYDFIARMDSDDVSFSDRIENQVKFLLENDDVDVLGTACQEFGATYSLESKVLPLTHSELVDFSITRCPFIHPTVMFRTGIFLDGTRYPENTSLTEDMALWFLLLEKGMKFSNLERPMLKFRLAEDTILRRKGLKKALSEMRLRFYYMWKLNRISFKNAFLISSRIVFHLMPTSLLKLAYKKLR